MIKIPEIIEILYEIKYKSHRVDLFNVTKRDSKRDATQL
jgi:hypothetical protein